MNVRARHNVTVTGEPGGPVVVLAHGFGCDQRVWRRVAQQLEREFQVVLFDYIGAGESDPAAWDPTRYSSLHGYADDVATLLRELELTDVTFVGHSVSAMIGVLAASAVPDRISKLVLLTPSPRYIDDADYRGGFSRADIDELMTLLDSNYLGWSTAMAPTIMGNADRPELSDELTETFCRTDPAVAQVFARTTFLSDNRADLAAVTVPTLVIDCRDDAIAPPTVGAYVHDRIRGSQLVTIDASGHCPHMSAPEPTAQLIATFAARTPLSCGRDG